MKIRSILCFLLLTQLGLAHNFWLQPEGKRDALNRGFGHKLELLPVALEGKTIRIRVLLNGKPLAKAQLSNGHEKSGETDAAGEFRVPYTRPVVYSTLAREPLENNPDAEKCKLRAVLSLP